MWQRFGLRVPILAVSVLIACYVGGCSWKQSPGGEQSQGLKEIEVTINLPRPHKAIEGIEVVLGLSRLSKVIKPGDFVQSKLSNRKYARFFLKRPGLYNLFVHFKMGGNLTNALHDDERLCASVKVQEFPVTQNFNVALSMPVLDKLLMSAAKEW